MAATRRLFTGRAMLFASSIVVALASPARASRDAEVSDRESSCLVLVWMDPHELLPAGKQWAATEALRVLEDADIGARWEWSREPGRDADGRASVFEHWLRVVLMPSEPSGPGWRLSSDTLGATVTDEENVPPAVYIFYNSIAATLRFRPERDLRTRLRAARAVGRIVAHEIAHAIVPFEPHASDGLMRASLGLRFLTAQGDVSIDPHWRGLLRRGMSRLCSER